MLKQLGCILGLWLALAALHPAKILLHNLCPYLLDQLLRATALTPSSPPI